MDAAVSTRREPRAAVSLRLPPELIRVVERYATEHRLSKTDAFLHFLTQGIAAEGGGEDASALERIERKVTEALRLIRDGRDAVADKGSVVRALRQACTEAPAIRRAYLFGSFARGTFDEKSDVDVRLELDERGGFSLRDLEHFARRVEELTKRSADVITAREIKNPALREAFERDKELVYDREEK